MAVTPASVRDLGLAAGGEVTAIFSGRFVAVGPDHPAERHGLGMVLFAAPTITDSRLRRVAAALPFELNLRLEAGTLLRGDIRASDTLLEIGAPPDCSPAAGR